MKNGQLDSKQEFEEMYEVVKAISQVGEPTTGTDEVTSLRDWMYDGDLRGVTPEEVAEEWDELHKEW